MIAAAVVLDVDIDGDECGWEIWFEVLKECWQ